MFFRQFYLGCLAQASYMIGSEGEAVVVDPRRDVEEYIEVARQEGLMIRHVVETHLHADFVSGHRELAERAGAQIYFGSRAGVSFPHTPVSDGDEVSVGRVTLRFLETPGHTPESVCVLVTDRSESPEPKLVLTGDTLFLGDVGRPDLLGAAISAEDLAGMLYDSLRQKLMRLPDSVEVYPGHGAGSLCGKNISSDTSSTIGQQKRVNHALQPMTREEFVRSMTTDLPEAPAYFARDVEMNRRGASSLGSLPPLAPLDPAAVERAAAAGAVVLDVRSGEAYAKSHLPGSIQIGLSGQFASWAGAVVPHGAPVILVAPDPVAAQEARMRLARVGIEDIAGSLTGGVHAWQESGRRVASTAQVDVEELHRRVSAGESPIVLDVRRPGEWESGTIPNAKRIPLHELARRACELDAGDPVHAVCAGGYRSSLATSLLERAGFTNITNVTGGMAAWTRAGFGTS
ncbi:MAG: MBL fold metallo-hydrolase [Acidobacteriota bacterium]